MVATRIEQAINFQREVGFKRPKLIKFGDACLTSREGAWVAQMTVRSHFDNVQPLIATVDSSESLYHCFDEITEAASRNYIDLTKFNSVFGDFAKSMSSTTLDLPFGHARESVIKDLDMILNYLREDCLKTRANSDSREQVYLYNERLNAILLKGICEGAGVKAGIIDYSVLKSNYENSAEAVEKLESMIQRLIDQKTMPILINGDFR